MKFIHCADIHLGSAIESLPSNISYKRRTEIRNTFEKLCEFAYSNDVTAIIIAGDLFDSEKVTNFTINNFLHIVSKYPKIDFLYLQGNHDPQILFESNLTNLKFFGGSWTSFNYGNVNIVGAKIIENNSEMLAASLKLKESDKNIVVLHGQIAGYKSTEKSEIISLPFFKEKNIDYLALGHYHSFDEGKIDNRGKYAYSGCLDGRGFDELGDKGFVLIEVEDSLKYEFKSFSSRNFYDFSFDLTEYTNFFTMCDDIVKFLKEKCSYTSLIKLTLKGEYDADFDIDIKELKAILNDAFYFVKIIDNTSMKIEKDYSLDKSIRGEFISEVLSSKLSEDVKKQVIMCGIRALKGENI